MGSISQKHCEPKLFMETIRGNGFYDLHMLTILLGNTAQVFSLRPSEPVNVKAQSWQTEWRLGGQCASVDSNAELKQWCDRVGLIKRGDRVSSLVVLGSIIQSRALLSSMVQALMCCLPTRDYDPAGL